MTQDPDLFHPAARRAQALLALGPAAIDALGGRVGESSAEALRLLDEASRTSAGLHEINARLLPLMTAFRALPRGLARWWHRFTGAALEHELLFPKKCAEVEQLASEGLHKADYLRRHLETLAQQRTSIDAELQTLEAEIAAARLLLAPGATARLAAAGFSADDLARLSRRAGNLEAMATALQLTHAQLGVAAEHARAVADRFDEVQRLLLPIWRQRLGFELFLQRLPQSSARN